MRVVPETSRPTAAPPARAAASLAVAIVGCAAARLPGSATLEIVCATIGASCSARVEEAAAVVAIAPVPVTKAHASGLPKEAVFDFADGVAGAVPAVGIANAAPADGVATAVPADGVAAAAPAVGVAAAAPADGVAAAAPADGVAAAVPAVGVAAAVPAAGVAAAAPTDGIAAPADGVEAAASIVPMTL